MTTLAFRSPVTLPIHPKEWSRPAGNTDFRVTQEFDDINPDRTINPQQLPHRATDLGNFRCGDPVVAMEAGTARTIGPDQYGALGVVITHAGGVETLYWHLNGFAIPQGSSPVSKGQQIGIVGRTGIGNVCHLHVELSVDGAKRDPQPYIFGASLEVEDMKLSGTFLRHVHNRSGTLTSNSHFRAGVVVGDDESQAIMPKGTLLFPVIVTAGRSAGTAPDRTEWYGAWLYVGGSGAGYRFGYVHSSVLPRTPDGKGVSLTPVEESGGYTANDLEAAKAEGAKAGQVDMKTRATVAVQGLAIK